VIARQMRVPGFSCAGVTVIAVEETINLEPFHAENLHIACLSLASLVSPRPLHAATAMSRWQCKTVAQVILTRNTRQHAVSPSYPLLVGICTDVWYASGDVKDSACADNGGGDASLCEAEAVYT
jgi:hypothetical protein